MDKDELQERMTNFAVRIIKMVDAMPSSVSGLAISRQVIRSGTSPSANYRAACLAKSDKDFVNKLNIALKEADETAYWLELLKEGSFIDEQSYTSIYNDCDELIKLLTSIIKTSKRRIEN